MDKNVTDVIEKYKTRADHGFKKYGVTEMQVIRLSPQGWLNVNDLLESEGK
jgi:hypothetical protein